MKRVAAAITLLAFAVFLSAITGYVFRKEMNSLLFSLESLTVCADTQSDELLIKETHSVLEKWRKSSVILHSLIMHEGMDELEESITSLPMILEHSGRDEFKLRCIDAVQRIRNLLNSEKIALENIL